MNYIFLLHCGSIFTYEYKFKTKCSLVQPKRVHCFSQFQSLLILLQFANVVFHYKVGNQQHIPHTTTNFNIRQYSSKWILSRVSSEKYDVATFLLYFGILSSVSGLCMELLHSQTDRHFVATYIYTGLTNSMNLNSLLEMVTLNTKPSMLSL